MKRLTYDEAHELIQYKHGELYWKPRPLAMFKTPRACSTWNKRFAGQIAGGYQVKGYRSLSVHKVMYVAHRVVWLMAFGTWPERDLKFKDGNRANIRDSNLYLSEPQENPSGHAGVQYDKGRWRARICRHGWIHNIGTFATIEEALFAQQEFKKKLDNATSNQEILPVAPAMNPLFSG